ncbi:MAG: hypothetical protein V2B18_09890, partial [Pseudomonadota bacterium]
MNRKLALQLLYVAAAAMVVYVYAHREALTNPYVINDDVRQQIYWMQEWREPGLFEGDPLTRYARNYVPFGVKAIYRVGAIFMDPIQFTKVVTGFVFVLTAVFLFLLGRELGDDVLGFLLSGTFFLFGGFLWRMSGGLSRSFVYPLLIAYLWYLARGDL